MVLNVTLEDDGAITRLLPILPITHGADLLEGIFCTIDDCTCKNCENTRGTLLVGKNLLLTIAGLDSSSSAVLTLDEAKALADVLLRYTEEAGELYGESDVE